MLENSLRLLGQAEEVDKMFFMDYISRTFVIWPHSGSYPSATQRSLRCSRNRGALTQGWMKFFLFGLVSDKTFFKILEVRKLGRG